MSSGDRVSSGRLALLLGPSLAVIVLLFGGGFAFSLLQSLGWQPLIGKTTLSLDAYANLLYGPQHQEVFWSGLVFSLWVSIASTVISAILAVLIALLIHRAASRSRAWSFLFQFNLPVPHLVAAVGILFLLSQSGLVSRGATALGLTAAPADFPVLVRDSSGWGIIITYVWKEMPFIGVIVLGVLKSLDESFVQAARNLGANAWQRFRHIVLPLIAPSLFSSSLIVFAFTFGAYEIPALLGVRFPRALPVTALFLFNDADLNSRAEAMALSVLITLVTSLVIGGYLWLRDIAQRIG
ncbi:MAG: ABC transporter permease subunit [Chloroflexi bacterium]|nr:ABC transporter permease subunit [Chloroflexota bacterium]